MFTKMIFLFFYCLIVLQTSYAQSNNDSSQLSSTTGDLTKISSSLSASQINKEISDIKTKVPNSFIGSTTSNLVKITSLGTSKKLIKEDKLDESENTSTKLEIKSTPIKSTLKREDKSSSEKTSINTDEKSTTRKKEGKQTNNTISNIESELIEKSTTTRTEIKTPKESITEKTEIKTPKESITENIPDDNNFPMDTKKNTIPENQKIIKNRKSDDDDDSNETSSSHIMIIIFFALLFTILGYVCFQKRKKIVAFVIEGRRRNSRERRTSGNKDSKVAYKPLDGEDKEAGISSYKYVPSL